MWFVSLRLGVNVTGTAFALLAIDTLDWRRGRYVPATLLSLQVAGVIGRRLSRGFTH
jgi:hypothetical protein